MCNPIDVAERKIDQILADLEREIGAHVDQVEILRIGGTQQTAVMMRTTGDHRRPGNGWPDRRPFAASPEAPK